MPQGVNQNNGTRRFTMANVNSFPPERWAAIVVLLSLGILILIRMGFRGVSVLGAKVSL